MTQIKSEEKIISLCHKAKVRVEPEDELNDPNGKTFWWVCTECTLPCDVILKEKDE